MAIFKYVAKNEYSETIKGKVEAKNKSQAAAALISRNLLVIEIKQLGEQSFSQIKSMIFGIKQTDLVNFTRQLATMISAGLPLATALSILTDQSKPEMSALVTKILKEIEGGSTFAQALEKQKGAFSRVYIQLVRAGEVGGVLDDVLERLAVTMEKQKDFRAKTKGAMIYPVIVLLAMFGVGAIMMIFVIPKLTEMYKDFGTELPITTKLLIWTSEFMVSFWWLGLLMIGGLLVGLHYWQKTKKGEEAIDQLLLKVPIVGVLRTKIVLTEFSRTLALLMSAGVSLLEALDVVAQALNSVTYRNILLAVKNQVEKGTALSQAFSHYEDVPSILPQMIAVGEETGKMDEILFKLSEYYEKESEYAVKNLTTAIEPIIMIILAIGVGLMVISIIMPIYSLTSQF